MAKYTQKQAEEKFITYRLQLCDTYLSNKTKVKAQCYCGNYFMVKPNQVFTGNTSSCGCYRKSIGSQRALNIQNEKFGRLLVLEKTDLRIHHSVVWKCLCDCGNYKNVSAYSLRSGETRSCGCLRPDMMLGVNNHCWNPNLTQEDRIKSRKTKKDTKWRKSVYTKDNYTCQVCGAKNCKLNAHHLDGWAENPELRYDVTNGVTLCINCHNKFHSIYGKKSIIRKQFQDFIKKDNV